MKYKYLETRGSLQEWAGKPAAPAAASMAAPAAASRKPERLPPGDLARRTIEPAILALVPAAVAHEHSVLPLAFDGERLTLAAVNPEEIALADKLRFALAKDVRLVGAQRSEILAAIRRYYGAVHLESADSLLQLAVAATMDFDEDAAAAGRDWRSGGRPLKRARGPLAAVASALGGGPPPAPAGARERVPPGVDSTPNVGGSGMFFEVVEEGQRVLMRRTNGTMEVIAGPRRVWRGWRRFQKMAHHVAHPGEYLIVRCRNGSQEHLAGPAEVWFDPRVHQEITREDALQISAKEAVVVYSRPAGSETISRRVVYGPALFVPEPGQWLHTFSWHGSTGGSQGVEKVANTLVFQKLWLMPDQMYHDVHDVRSSDDAVLMIRLMIFFELLDIERMLDATHDPIGDFVNAATSDIVDFTGKYDFDAFKQNTDKLNLLETYRQLTSRAEKCGYRINKVVYRGYGAPPALQQMHNQAIEARTRLQLERATENQAQDLENYKLECQLARATKRRAEQTHEVEHDLELARMRQQAEIEQQEARQAFLRRQMELDAQTRLETARREDARRQEHLGALRAMGVDLTAYLTQARADRVVEVRGSAGTHLHLSPDAPEAPSGEKSSA